MFSILTERYPQVNTVNLLRVVWGFLQHFFYQLVLRIIKSAKTVILNLPELIIVKKSTTKSIHFFDKVVEVSLAPLTAI